MKLNYTLLILAIATSVNAVEITIENSYLSVTAKDGSFSISAPGKGVIVSNVLFPVKVEKTETSADDIEQAFGPEMRAMVTALGQDPAFEDHLERKADHRRRVCEADSRVRLVHSADRLAGIQRMLARLEAGDDPEDLDARRRLESWRVDREMLAGLAIPEGLLARIEDSLSRLETGIAQGM